MAELTKREIEEIKEDAEFNFPDSELPDHKKWRWDLREAYVSGRKEERIKAKELVDALRGLIFTAGKLWDESNKRDGWDLDVVIITHPSIEQAEQALTNYYKTKQP